MIYRLLVAPLPVQGLSKVDGFQVEDSADAEDDRQNFSPFGVVAFRDQNQVFEDVVGYNDLPNVVLTDDYGTREIHGTAGAEAHAGAGAPT